MCSQQPNLDSNILDRKIGRQLISLVSLIVSAFSAFNYLLGSPYNYFSLGQLTVVARTDGNAAARLEYNLQRMPPPRACLAPPSHVFNQSVTGGCGTTRVRGLHVSSANILPEPVATVYMSTLLGIYPNPQNLTPPPQTDTLISFCKMSCYLYRNA